MNSVWLAKHADRQFEKNVATKLLKRGADTDEVLRRLHVEPEALPMCEQLVASDPQSAPDSCRLMQTCARIAAMLNEIAAGTNDAATHAEAFAFHERTCSSMKRPGKNPDNLALRRRIRTTAKPNKIWRALTMLLVARGRCFVR